MKEVLAALEELSRTCDRKSGEVSDSTRANRTLEEQIAVKSASTRATLRLRTLPYCTRGERGTRLRGANGTVCVLGDARGHSARVSGVAGTGRRSEEDDGGCSPRAAERSERLGNRRLRS